MKGGLTKKVVRVEHIGEKGIYPSKDKLRGLYFYQKIGHRASSIRDDH
ncbi:MAG: hypothetical protein M0R38_13170 [Bacteroidia bacterium]|jgi:hypothetical protein|nr:hypothetical protein [Bacteroidia bacterium]